ncbi:uncharacterized protein LOC106080604 [Stomoxys calcitrans]|uniref:uncharacterized protein LOC106080604 n=1 Tax=Stomoxys calcitrans TaxID=35570 RepID=UPI0027E25E98|nr:uncharacterized protein LOC106080604 [Stomoxys calcitrans]
MLISKMFNTIFAFLMLFGLGILAERPEWYPENAAEIDAECMKKHVLSAEIMEKLKNDFTLEDTPTMRSLVFCSALGKQVFRPNVGFEAVRVVEGLQENAKLNCSLVAVQHCADQFKTANSNEAMFFSTMKCLFDNISENCSKIKETE